MDDKRKHLEFLQAAVARLANNSFAYKGWAVTVVVAALALIGQGRGPDKAAPDAILAGLIPALAFWALDARCVRRERMFRCLYDDVRVSNTTDYSMDASRFGDNVGTIWRIACTGDLAALYGALVLLTFALRLLRNWGFV